MSLGETPIDNFNQLKVFPTVREAMIKEIKSQYNLKGDNVPKLKKIYLLSQLLFKLVLFKP